MRHYLYDQSNTINSLNYTTYYRSKVRVSIKIVQKKNDLIQMFVNNSQLMIIQFLTLLMMMVFKLQACIVNKNDT